MIVVTGQKGKTVSYKVLMQLWDPNRGPCRPRSFLFDRTSPTALIAMLFITMALVLSSQNPWPPTPLKRDVIYGQPLTGFFPYGSNLSPRSSPNQIEIRNSVSTCTSNDAQQCVSRIWVVHLTYLFEVWFYLWHLFFVELVYLRFFKNMPLCRTYSSKVFVLWIHFTVCVSRIWASLLLG